MTFLAYENRNSCKGVGLFSLFRCHSRASNFLPMTSPDHTESLKRFEAVFPYLKHSNKCAGRRHYAGVHPSPCDCGIVDENAATFDELKAFLASELTLAYQEGEKDAEERVKEIIEESEWECPEHGKEFRITPPLCKECNQCLEVNVILVNLLASIDSRS